MGEEESRLELEHQGTPHMPPDTPGSASPASSCRRGFPQKGTAPGGGRGWGRGEALAASPPTHRAAQGCQQEAGSTPTFLMAHGAHEEGQNRVDERGHRVLLNTSHGAGSTIFQSTCQVTALDPDGTHEIPLGQVCSSLLSDFTLITHDAWSPGPVGAAGRTQGLPSEV